MADGKHAAAGLPARIYAYVDDDGNPFWSFTKYPSTVSPSKRLTLQSRSGITVPAFAAYVRELAVEISAGPDEGTETTEKTD